MRRNQHQSLVENREEEVKEKPLRIQDPFSERALTGKEIGASRSSGGRTGRGCFVLSSMKEACNGESSLVEVWDLVPASYTHPTTR